MRGLSAAVAFLTVIPVPRAGSGLAAAAPWFGLVGLGIGGAAAGAWLLASWAWDGSLLAGVAAIAVLAGLSGMLHLDGLADVADAALAPVSPERRREIVRDVHHGTFGTTVLLLVLLLQAASLALLPRTEGALALLVAGGCSRGTLPALMRVARPMPGSAMLAAALPGASPRNIVLAAVVPVATVALLANLQSLAVAGGVVLSGAAVALFAAGRLGGVNGDVLGAATELGQTGGLLAGAALAAHGISGSPWEFFR